MGPPPPAGRGQGGRNGVRALWEMEQSSGTSCGGSCRWGSCAPAEGAGQREPGDTKTSPPTQGGSRSRGLAPGKILLVLGRKTRREAGEGRQAFTCWLRDYLMSVHCVQFCAGNSGHKREESNLNPALRKLAVSQGGWRIRGDGNSSVEFPLDPRPGHRAGGDPGGGRPP